MTSALLEILEALEGRGVQGHGAVWRIEGASSQVEQCKIELLESICRDARPFVHYEEPPMGEPGLEGSVEVAQGVWQVPLGVAAPALLKWLYLGNWQLYVRAEPLPKISDLCRCTDVEIEAFLSQCEASVVIDSFHDDVSWVLCVRQ